VLQALSAFAANVPNMKPAQFLEFDRAGVQNLLSGHTHPAQFLRAIALPTYFPLPGSHSYLDSHP